MEVFAKVALENAPYISFVYKYFMDDTFLRWPHGMEKPNDFVALNGFHKNITFTMELELYKSVAVSDS